jgi:hypothetical protein
MAFPIRKVRKPADLTGKTNGQLPDHMMKAIADHGKMHHLAADAWNAMRTAALNDGVVLSNVGSYRSYNSQLSLFMQRYVTGDSGDHRRIFRTFQGQKWMLKPKMAPAAAPGTSNHGWGLAIDACLLVDGKRIGIGSKPPASRYKSTASLGNFSLSHGTFVMSKVMLFLSQFVSGWLPTHLRHMLRLLPTFLRPPRVRQLL